MPPRKLKDVIRFKDGVQLSHGYILGGLPQFAVPIMQVIENSARTSGRIELMLAKFLKVEVHIAMKMLYSIESENARRDVVTAAAKHVLTDDDFRLFTAVVDLSRASLRRRNMFAHQVWATSPLVPDAVILMDPQAMNDYEARTAELNRDRRKSFVQLMPPGASYLEDAHVFTVEDLEEAVRESFLIDQLVGRLAMLVKDPDDPSADARRQELLAEPRIAQRFAPRSKKKPRRAAHK